jgi:hypothetical protein
LRRVSVFVGNLRGKGKGRDTAETAGLAKGSEKQIAETAGSAAKFLSAPLQKSEESFAGQGEYTAVQKLAILRMNLVEKIPLKLLCEQYRLDYDTFYRWQTDLFDWGDLIFQGAREMHEVLEHLAQKRFRPLAILDIGAGEGYWSLLAGRLFDQAKVFMVEASAEKERSLRFICENDPRYHYITEAVLGTSNAPTGRERGGKLETEQNYMRHLIAFCRREK